MTMTKHFLLDGEPVATFEISVVCQICQVCF